MKITGYLFVSLFLFFVSTVCPAGGSTTLVDSTANGNDGELVRMDSANDWVESNATRSNSYGPGAASGLALWLKADAGIVETGGEVDQWIDQSGNGLDFSGAGGARPDFQAAAAENFNFNPNVDFNLSEYMTTANGSCVFTGAGDPAEIFIVANAVSGSSKYLGTDIDSSPGTGAQGDYPAIMSNGDNKLQFYNETGYVLKLGSTSLPYGSTHLLAYRWAGGSNSVSLEYNGTNDGNHSANTTTGTYRNIIGEGPGGNNAIDANIAEIVVYRQELNSTQRQKTRSYLAIKYGITLDSAAGPYVASDYDTLGTVWWDFDDTAGYHDDIAGIAMDAASELLQPKSKSINGDSILTVELPTGGTRTLRAAADAFPGDKYGLVWGHNGGDTNYEDTPVGTTNTVVMNRKWIVEDNGVNGAGSFGALEYSVPASTGASQMWIDRDGDGDFTTGTVDMIDPVDPQADPLVFSADVDDGQVFTFAFTIYGPGEASGLVLWLKADAGIVETGGEIDQWIDQSGNGLDFSGAGGTRPDFQAAAAENFNFNPNVDFNLSDYMTTANGRCVFTGAGDPAEIFIVANAVSGSIKYLGTDIDSSPGTGAQGDYPAIMSNGDNNLQFYNETGYVLKLGSTSLPYGSTHLLGYRWAGGSNSVSLEYNGTNDGNHSANTTTGAYRNIIGEGPGGNNAIDANIAEIVVYRQELNSTQRQKTRSYLAIKYGITLDSAAGPYVASDYDTLGTVWWDFDDTAGYHDDIAGIAMDAASELLQPKSKSINGDSILTVELPTGGTRTLRAAADAFPGDKYGLVWGHNGGDTNYEDTPVGTTNTMVMNRKWIVEDNGVNGAGSFGALEYSVPASTGASQMWIDRDGDGDFTTGTVDMIDPVDPQADPLVFSADVDDGQVFTFAVLSAPTPTYETCEISQPESTNASVTGEYGQSFIPCASGRVWSITVYANTAATGKLSLYKTDRGYNDADLLFEKDNISFNGGQAATVVDLSTGGTGDTTVSQCNAYHFRLEAPSTGWVKKDGGDAYPDGHLLVTAGIVKDQYDLKFDLEIEKTPRPETVTAVSVDPVDDKLNVPVESDIVVQFSEPICESTLDGDSFQVSGSVNGAYSGNFSVAGDTVRFTPDSVFQPSETVTVTLTQVIEDTSGNILDAETVSSFKTLAACSARNPKQRPGAQLAYSTIGQSFEACYDGVVTSVLVFCGGGGTGGLALYKGAAGFKAADEIFRIDNVPYIGHPSGARGTWIQFSDAGIELPRVVKGETYHFKAWTNASQGNWYVIGTDSYPDGDMLSWNGSVFIGYCGTPYDLVFTVNVAPDAPITNVTKANPATPAPDTTQTFKDGDPVAEVTWSATGTPPDNLDLTYNTGDNYPNLPAGVDSSTRTWSFNATGGGDDWSATVKLYYEDADIAALSGESSIQVWKTDDSGFSWTEAMIVARNEAENWIEVEITSFSDFVLTDEPLGVPAAPEDPAAVSVDSATNRLSWTDRSASETSFVVEYAYDTAGPFSSVVVNSSTIAETMNTVRYDHAGFTQGRTVYYRVKARNSLGDSDPTYVFGIDGSVNLPPETSGIPSAAVNSDLENSVIDLWDCFSDDHDPVSDLAFSIQSNSNPDLFDSAQIVDGRYLVLDYATGPDGTATLVVRATDSEGLFVETDLQAHLMAETDAIPTLNQWGILLLIGLVFLASLRVVATHRNKKAVGKRLENTRIA